MTFAPWARRLMASGVAYSVLQRRARVAASTAILMYHTLGPDDEQHDAWTVVRQSDFQRQLDVLRRTHDIVSIDSMLEGAASERPRAVLTFDDGHDGWRSHLLPIVEREGVPVTLYVATEHILSGKLYWFDRIMNAVQLASAATVELGTFGLGRWTLAQEKGGKAWHVTSRLLEALKDRDDDVREACADAVETQLRNHARRSFTPLRPLAIDHVAELARSSWVTVGAHSHDHRLLDRISIEAAGESIAVSCALLETWTGKKPRHFAYPNGNFNALVAARVEGMGLRSAVTTMNGLRRTDTNAYSLPRISVGRYDDIDRFKLSLAPRT